MKNRPPYGYIPENKEYPKWKLILRRKRIILTVFAVSLILAAGFTFLQETWYKASAAINFNSAEIQKYLASNQNTGNNRFAGLNTENLIEEVAQNLLKNKNLNKNTNIKTLPIVIKALKSSGDLNNQIHFIKTRLKDWAQFETDKMNGLVRITCMSQNANQAAVLANLFANLYYQKSVLDNMSGLTAALKYLKEQKEKRQKELQRSKLAYQKFTEAVESIELNDNEKILINKISELESELEVTDMQLKIKGMMLSSYAEELDKILPDKAPELIDITDKQVIKLQDIIEKTEAKNAVLSVMKIYKDFKPTLSWQDFKINNLDTLKNQLHSLISDYTKTVIKSDKIVNTNLVVELVTKIQNLKLKNAEDDLVESIIYDALTELEQKYNKIGFKKNRIARLTRNLNFNQKLYDKIGNKYQLLSNQELNSTPSIEYIEYAKIPNSPFKPNLLLNLLFGGILGLIIGTVIAYRMSIFGTNVISSEDLEFLGFKIISTIPHIGKNKPLLLKVPEHNKRDEYNEASNQEVLDAFHRVSAFLKYGSLEQTIKSVLVTSTGLEEGKSFVASNLAISLAQEGHSVLLVDFNLKRPRLHKFFKVNSKPSFAHYLFRKEELERVIKKTHVEGLSIITSIEFPQDPSVIITSERMEKFVSLANEKYDYIIYDGMALFQCEEEALLAEILDEIIVVVRANKTSFTDLKKGSAIFSKFNVTPDGYILNDTNNPDASTTDKNKRDGFSNLPARRDHYKRFQKSSKHKSADPNLKRRKT